MVSQTATVGKHAPEFDLSCTSGPGLRRRVALADYRDRWLILVFYPRDFSLVCPTGAHRPDARMEDLRSRGCDILGVSTDSLESHERWIATPRSRAAWGDPLSPGQRP